MHVRKEEREMGCCVRKVLVREEVQGVHKPHEHRQAAAEATRLATDRHLTEQEEKEGKGIGNFYTSQRNKV